MISDFYIKSDMYDTDFRGMLESWLFMKEEISVENVTLGIQKNEIIKARGVINNEERETITSRIVRYDPNLGYVMTKSGSIYKLGQLRFTRSFDPWISSETGRIELKGGYTEDLLDEIQNNKYDTCPFELINLKII